jgi:hypothetical protein
MKLTIWIIAILWVFRPALPLVEYAVNYQYIKENLCVNKAKPAMHCNGKCHLRQQLAEKAASKEQSPNPSKSSSKYKWQLQEMLFEQSAACIRFQLLDEIKVIKFDPAYFFLFGTFVFHPPAA